MRIEAVLFDFGGVFMDSPFAAVRAYGERVGVDPERIAEIIFGRYDEDTDHPWHRLERGELSLDAARQAIRDLAAPHTVDLYEALATLSRSSVRPEMIESARAARASGRRTAIVTNNVREFGDGWRSMLPLDELFDAVIDSAHEGVRKPDPRIYNLALERLGGVSAAATVFLDDFHGNIAAAERCGMRGILVGDDWRQALRDLDDLLR